MAGFASDPISSRLREETDARSASEAGGSSLVLCGAQTHASGPYVLDFFCPAAKLAIEVDGEAHALGDRPVRDRLRDAFLAEQGIETLRIGARSVLIDADWAVEEVMRQALARVEGASRL